MLIPCDYCVVRYYSHHAINGNKSFSSKFVLDGGRGGRDVEGGGAGGVACVQVCVSACVRTCARECVYIYIYIYIFIMLFN